MSREGASSVKAVVLIDVPELSVDGTLYMMAMMEALDGSMDADKRSTFFNKMIGQFAAGSPSGRLEMASPAMKYVLSWEEKYCIFGMTPAK
jgi:hypothetical protein